MHSRIEMYPIRDGDVMNGKYWGALLRVRPLTCMVNIVRDDGDGNSDGGTGLFIWRFRFDRFDKNGTKFIISYNCIQLEWESLTFMIFYKSWEIYAKYVLIFILHLVLFLSLVF